VMVTFGLSPCTVAVQYFNAPFSAPTFLHSILICFPASYGLQRWPLIHPSPETYLSTVDDVSRQRDSKHSNSNTMMPPPLSLSLFLFLLGCRKGGDSDLSRHSAQKENGQHGLSKCLNFGQIFRTTTSHSQHDQHGGSWARQKRHFRLVIMPPSEFIS